MRSTSEYKERLTWHLRARLAWGALPRSASAVLGALVLVTTLAPTLALAVWAASWLTLNRVVRSAPGFHNREDWKWLAPVAYALNSSTARWALLIAAAATALRHGLTLGLAAAAGWLALDAWYLLSPAKEHCAPGAWPACS
jgi:hypothetical protein